VRAILAVRHLGLLCRLVEVRRQDYIPPILGNNSVV